MHGTVRVRRIFAVEENDLATIIVAFFLPRPLLLFMRVEWNIYSSTPPCCTRMRDFVARVDGAVAFEGGERVERSLVDHADAGRSCTLPLLVQTNVRVGCITASYELTVVLAPSITYEHVAHVRAFHGRYAHPLSFVPAGRCL